MPTLEHVLRSNTAPSSPEIADAFEDGRVRCHACANRCTIRPGEAGVCKVRFNEGGRLMVPWGYVAGLAADPIEKKPFYHVMPGSQALSFGMLGCNFHCDFCQNWVSSQTLRDEGAWAEPTPMQAQRIVAMARESGAASVISTYNEPLITVEWAVEVFRLAAADGLLCGVVSNGNATTRVLDYLRPWARLFKVDLKVFDDQRYRRLGGVLANVCNAIAALRERGFWVEVVTLLIPGFNDEDAEIRGLARFLASVSRDIPWHVTAFHPDYRMGGQRTTPQMLVRAAEAAREAGLRYVYAGNIPGSVGEWENTRCPACGKVVVERSGFRVLGCTVGADGLCDGCGAAIPGVWGAGASGEYS